MGCGWQMDRVSHFISSNSGHIFWPAQKLAWLSPPSGLCSWYWALFCSLMAPFSRLETCDHISATKVSGSWISLCIGLVLVGPHADHRTNKDVLLLRSETENAWDGMLYRRNIARVLEVAVHWGNCRDIWVFEFVWVRIVLFFTRIATSSVFHRDFFPVILTFLRQLPFIGNLLSLPYIRDVSWLWSSLFRGWLQSGS